MTTTTATNPRPTATGIPDGVDLDVEVHFEDGTVLEGEITLLNGRAYGNSPDHWVSRKLLRQLETLFGDKALDLAQLLQELEQAGQAAESASIWGF